MNPYKVDTFAEHERFMERLDQKIAEDARRRRDADAKAAKERELPDLKARILSGDITAFKAHLERIAREHAVTIRGWVTSWRASQANKPTRYVLLSDITTGMECDEAEMRYATGLHELGHCLSEPCSGGLHERVYTTDQLYVDCVRCEAEATRIALELALVPFSKATFAHLARCLRSYRDVAAPSAALRQLNAVAGSVQFTEHRQRHVMRAWREERQAAANADLKRAEQRARDREMARIREFSDRLLERMERS